MFAITVLLAIILAVAFGFAGAGKLTGSRQVLEIMEHVGVGPALRGAIGILEVVAALGLILGLFEALEWIGIVTAVGLIGLMGGAVAFHLRVGDHSRGVTPPAILLVLSVLLLIFRAISA